MTVIVVLISMALPAIHSARQRSRVVQCTSRMRQVGVALQHHQTDHQALPRDGFNGYGYCVYLLPYMEQSNMYGQLDPEKTKRSNASTSQKALWVTPLPGFLCPNFDREQTLDSTGFGRSNFLGNGELLLKGMDLANVFDGESSTAIAWETVDDQSWNEPGTAVLSSSSSKFSSRHPSGSNVLMCDGAVKFLNDTVDSKIVTAIGTPNGREPVSNF